MYRHFSLLAALILVSACSTVTIQPKEVGQVSSKPDYQKSHHFFIMGLFGDKEIDVRKICKNTPVKQMQTVATFKDSAASIVTMGVYTPHTVKVWCDKNTQQVGQS